jgi:nitrate reductase NapAB chaperone NapD
MEFLETSVNDFDIVVVIETHLDNQINDSDITLDSLPNIIHRKNRSNSGGGLLVYSKNDISYK